MVSPTSEFDDLSDRSADVFAERLLQVIDDGQRTATYKLALLLALIDGCAAEAGADGRAPAVLSTRTIAEHVVRLYLPQVRLYLGGDGDPLHLRQISNRSSAVLGAVLGLHLAAESARCRTLLEMAKRLPAELERCLDEVERTFARYPIRLLQVVGRQERRFLYDVDWGESVSLRALHTVGGGQVRFRPGAADQLLRLAPLVRPLVEFHWIRMVGRLNGVAIEEERLRAHLFGTDRSAFPLALREGLADLQARSCFYCQRPLPVRTQVDHFLPWSRWPNDAIENLVLADGCNGRKSDYLPALVHVDRWATRLDRSRAELAGLAAASSWTSEPHRSLSLARSCYAHVPTGTPLWELTDRFVDADPSILTNRLQNVRLDG